jgi:hypothetical protein
LEIDARSLDEHVFEDCGWATARCQQVDADSGVVRIGYEFVCESADCSFST